MIYLIWGLSLFILYYYLTRKYKKRINEIISLIDNLKSKDYSIPMRQDDFSILEDKIYKLFVELVEEKENTKNKSDKQIEYLEDIAHQIKTPITSMLFSIENYSEKDEDIKILKRQILRLNSLSDILLKLSSLDARENSMKKEKINLYELVEYSLDTINIRKDLKININKDLKEYFIIGDFYWISEAITNILKNASDRKSCSFIEINAIKNPIYVLLSIKDDGGGIKDKDFKKIFKRFYKTPDSNGFGIGLSMAKKIIDKNNGEIEVSNEDYGAKFEIKFYNVT